MSDESQDVGVANGAPERRGARLPSEHYVPGNPRPAGFVESPGRGHFNATGAVLAKIAEQVSAPPMGTRELRIRLCHLQLDPLLSPALFGFHLLPVSADGEYLDEFEDDLELSYAVVANQSAELQQETALVFLLQLVYRQRRQAEMRDEGIPIEGIDFEMARQDEHALEEIRDVVNPLAYGWTEAAKLIRERASDVGLALRVRYEVDPFPRLADITARIPFLRQTYNELEVVRKSIDKVVSMVGGTSPRIGGRGPGELRDFLQQRMLIMHFREYTNHAFRDGEVCGNGYLVHTNQEPLGFYNLRPEAVEIEKNGSAPTYRVGGTKLPAGTVSHVRGIEQQESPYGVSLLEVALPVLRSGRLLANAQQAARRALSNPVTPGQERYLRGLLELADRMDQDMKERLDRLFWFPESHLPEPTEHLYFTGFERI